MINFAECMCLFYISKQKQSTKMLFKIQLEKKKKKKKKKKKGDCHPRGKAAARMPKAERGDRG
jgi:ribosomal protein L19E